MWFRGWMDTHFKTNLHYCSSRGGIHSCEETQQTPFCDIWHDRIGVSLYYREQLLIIYCQKIDSNNFFYKIHCIGLFEGKTKLYYCVCSGIACLRLSFIVEFVVTIVSSWRHHVWQLYHSFVVIIVHCCWHRREFHDKRILLCIFLWSPQQSNSN